MSVKPIKWEKCFASLAQLLRGALFSTDCSLKFGFYLLLFKVLSSKNRITEFICIKSIIRICCKRIHTRHLTVELHRKLKACGLKHNFDQFFLHINNIKKLWHFSKILYWCASEFSSSFILMRCF